MVNLVKRLKPTNQGVQCIPGSLCPSEVSNSIQKRLKWSGDLTGGSEICFEWLYYGIMIENDLETLLEQLLMIRLPRNVSKPKNARLS